MVNQLKNKIKNELVDLYAKFQFWKAKKNISEKDFRYVPTLETDADFLIEILKKPYAGVIVKISEFKMREEGEEGILDFTTYVVQNPKNANVSRAKFNKMVTDIVRFILIQSTEKIDVKDVYEDRNSNTLELVEERPVSEESTTVSKKRVSKGKSRKKAVPGNTEVLPKVQQPTKPKRAKTSSGRKKRSNGA